jgi:hypothetical protein
MMTVARTILTLFFAVSLAALPARVNAAPATDSKDADVG